MKNVWKLLFSKVPLLIFAISMSSSFFSHLIDYDNPEIYKLGGDQTRIENQAWIEEIKNQFPTFENSIDQLKKVRRWIKDTFVHENNHGATIGKFTVDQLYQSRAWHGCHDIAHIFAATVRSIGYPCVLVETTSITWSGAYVKDPSSAGVSQGHNYAEVFVNNKWILFDPMSPAYLDDYNSHNPVIPPIFDTYKGELFYKDEPDGFYVMAKGKDCLDYGIKSVNDLLLLQKKIAPSCFKPQP
ncbi:MAG: transglutaminase domain-containing protein [Chlamydiae bacterium]|nr:transglutaminase domain-containing protein [Chlamydiota bacterium]